jgi:hypothetical protein
MTTAQEKGATMSYEEDDCLACKKENATLFVFPDQDGAYNKVCDDLCMQTLAEDYFDRHNALSW